MISGLLVLLGMFISLFIFCYGFVLILGGHCNLTRWIGLELAIIGFIAIIFIIKFTTSIA